MSTGEPQQLYIAGRRRLSGDIRDVKDIWSGETIDSICFAGKEDVEEAIHLASSMFTSVAKTPAHRRSEVCKNISRIILQRKDTLAKTIVSECGKPMLDAIAEVERAAQTFNIASAEALNISGEIIPLDLTPKGEGKQGIVSRFPIGPITGISPFNFPLNLVAHKVAPAIASGNPIIIKSSSKTPLTAILLAQIAHDAGLPEGFLSVLPCDSKIAAPLIEDKRIKMVTFTGSADVGWDIKRRCGKKKVTLELGGNAGVIVHDDANVEIAAQKCCNGAFSYCGQICISVQRIFVHEKLFDHFRDALVDNTKKLVMGNPHEKGTDIGPIIDNENAGRVDDWVSKAIRKGAKVLCGGKGDKRLYLPTVLTNVDATTDIYSKEAFGPVVIIAKYSDFDEALRLVNDSTYGLQAGVFTNNIDRIMKAYNVLDVGGVIINDVPTFRTDNMPYGGVKNSGMGREGVKYAMEEMTERKLLVLPDSVQ